MARWAPGTARGDFSILLSDMPSLDADPKSTDPEARLGYTAFGRVSSWDGGGSPDFRSASICNF